VVAIPAADVAEQLVCCAYVPAAGRRVTPAALRRQLARLLPDYMVPARWRAFDQLPLKPSGKADRSELQRFFVDGPAVAH
jgi:acyl-CoA synthetase (AMP-forming)/AMP-acid ligase II